MRKLFFAVFILIAIVSCDKKPNNPVAEYGDIMINSYQKGKQAGVEQNLDAVRRAVDAYHATNDRYPQNLDEVQPLIGSAVDFSKYDYNPQNGTVNLKAN